MSVDYSVHWLHAKTLGYRILGLRPKLNWYSVSLIFPLPVVVSARYTLLLLQCTKSIDGRYSILNSYCVLNDYYDVLRNAMSSSGRTSVYLWIAFS